MYLCLEHFNQHYGFQLTEQDILLSPQFCEHCGKETMCVGAILHPDYEENRYHQNEPPQSHVD